MARPVVMTGPQNMPKFDLGQRRWGSCSAFHTVRRSSPMGSTVWRQRDRCQREVVKGCDRGVRLRGIMRSLPASHLFEMVSRPRL